MKIHNDLFEKIVSLENLFDSWHGFRLGKKNKKGVSVFERHLEDNIFALHEELRAKSYRHDQYTSFYITDPKVRHIHKASVKDRVVHHAIFKILYPIFDPSFIHDSYSCRIDKGTHRAVKRLEQFIRKVGKNDSGQCFVLKCDIKKFFASVDQEILSEIIERRVSDPDLLWLMKEIVGSFSAESLDTQLSLFGPPTERERERERERDDGLWPSRKGIPIGNLTSQLFANIYMNELDQFMKHKLKVKYYIRYADDFVIVSDSEDYLKNLLPKIQSFLGEKLKLNLHPNKISIRKAKQGIDFLGYILLPHHRIVRTKTKRRILKKLKMRAREYGDGIISQDTLNQSLQSYLGVMSHANSYGLKKKILEIMN